MVLLRVHVQAQRAVAHFQFIVHAYQRAHVVLVGVLELHHDPPVLGDQFIGREGDLRGVVVDHVVVVLAPRQLHPIDEHPFGAAEHDDERFALVPLQPVGPLDPLHALDQVACELALGDGHAGTGPVGGALPGFQRGVEAEALGLLQVGQEVAVGALQHEVAGDQFPVLVEQLDEHLVEVLELQGVATGLDGDVVVGDRGQHLDAVGEPSGEFQVQGGVHREVLVVPEEHAARDAPALVEALRGKEVAGLAWGHVAEGVLPVAGGGDQLVGVLMAERATQQQGHHPIGGPQRVGGWAALPDQQGLVRQQFIGRGVERYAVLVQSKASRHDAQRVQVQGVLVRKKELFSKAGDRYLRERVQLQGDKRKEQEGPRQGNAVEGRYHAILSHRDHTPQRPENYPDRRVAGLSPLPC